MKKKAKVGDRIRLSDLLRIRDGRPNIPGEAYTVLEITEGQAAVPLFALSGMFGISMPVPGTLHYYLGEDEYEVVETERQ